MSRAITRYHAPLRALCPLRVYNSSGSGLVVCCLVSAERRPDRATGEPARSFIKIHFCDFSSERAAEQQMCVGSVVTFSDSSRTAHDVRIAARSWVDDRGRANSIERKVRFERPGETAQRKPAWAIALTDICFASFAALRPFCCINVSASERASEWKIRNIKLLCTFPHSFEAAIAPFNLETSPSRATTRACNFACELTASRPRRSSRLSTASAASHTS